MKALSIAHKFSVETDTLSRTVYASDALQVLWGLATRSPKLGKGWVRWSILVPNESPHYCPPFFSGNRHAISHRIRASRPASFGVWGPDPQNLGRGGVRGFTNGPIRKSGIGFLLVPHSDQSAISNRFRTT